ncbi:MAG: 30S ribosomal protein S6 [Candidatus Aminicenantes bacterium]|nr:30S ribosomal protein S6 [Candidatus Aminicenantes bacterium]
MRYYETAFLIAPNLSEEETEQLIGKMGDVVKKNKGQMLDVDKWGKRKLAYPIKKHDAAFYVFFYYQGIPETSAELERQFKQKETIIRHLTLKREEKPALDKEAKEKPERKKPAPKKKEEEKPETKNSAKTSKDTKEQETKKKEKGDK